MILYQLAKWMEERTRLKKHITEARGDVTYLALQKEQVEERLKTQAMRWCDGTLNESDFSESPRVPAEEAQVEREPELVW